MGYAQFRAGFAGDASNEWSVSASDTFLKQNEDTHIVVRYNPHSPGTSNAYLVIEAEVSSDEPTKPSQYLKCIVLLTCFDCAAGLQDDLEGCWKYR